MKIMINLTLISIITILHSSLSFFGNTNNLYVMSAVKDSSYYYYDGTYQGRTQASYSSEPFWGNIQISVVNGLFTDIRFSIRDSSTHEYVDSMYGVIHYSGNQEYMKQCVNEEHGIASYPKKLLKSQNLDNIDGISGATWSYNFFIASAKEALKDAKK